MKSYRSDAERNIWHGAAEGWETSGRAYLDPCGFPGPRRVPRVGPRLQRSPRVDNALGASPMGDRETPPAASP